MPGLLIGREGPAAVPHALGCRGHDNHHDTMRAAPFALMEAVRRLKGRNDKHEGSGRPRGCGPDMDAEPRIWSVMEAGCA